MHPYYHALSSVKKHHGKVEDYLPIHNWFDQSKSGYADFRHRAMLHHSEGIFLCEKVFGVTITNSDGIDIPTRFIGEQHVIEDLGRIPSMKDWVSKIRPESWMYMTPRSIEKAVGVINVADDNGLGTVIDEKQETKQV